MPDSAVKLYQNRFVGHARALQVDHHRTRLIMPRMHDGNITIARVQGACFNAVENNRYYYHTPSALITRNSGD